MQTIRLFFSFDFFVGFTVRFAVTIAVRRLLSWLTWLFPSATSDISNAALQTMLFTFVTSSMSVGLYMGLSGFNSLSSYPSRAVSLFRRGSCWLRTRNFIRGSVCSLVRWSVGSSRSTPARVDKAKNHACMTLQLMLSVCVCVCVVVLL